MTISETFARYNTLVVLYSCGPFSLIFTFRVFRTLTNESIPPSQKKIILILLILVQYTTMVVVRNDTIRGPVHFIFTFLTVMLILIYHNVVCESPNILKKNIGAAALLSLCFFTGMLLLDLQELVYLWGLTCFFEIFGISLLSILDLIDVYNLGCRLDLQ